MDVVVGGSGVIRFSLLLAVMTAITTFSTKEADDLQPPFAPLPPISPTGASPRWKPTMAPWSTNHLTMEFELRGSLFQRQQAFYDVIRGVFGQDSLNFSLQDLRWHFVQGAGGQRMAGGTRGAAFRLPAKRQDCLFNKCV